MCRIAGLASPATIPRGVASRELLVGVGRKHRRGRLADEDHLRARRDEPREVRGAHPGAVLEKLVHEIGVGQRIHRGLGGTDELRSEREGPAAAATVRRVNRFDRQDTASIIARILSSSIGSGTVSFLTSSIEETGCAVT